MLHERVISKNLAGRRARWRRNENVGLGDQSIGGLPSYLLKISIDLLAAARKILAIVLCGVERFDRHLEIIALRWWLSKKVGEPRILRRFKKRCVKSFARRSSDLRYFVLADDCSRSIDGDRRNHAAKIPCGMKVGGALEERTLVGGKPNLETLAAARKGGRHRQVLRSLVAEESII